MPKRIQMTRNKPWRHEHSDAVIVDRRNKWGNPWIPRSQHRADLRVLVVDKYKRALADGELPFTVEDVRTELAGKDLACWCPLPAPGETDHCHAAVLIELANKDTSAVERVPELGKPVRWDHRRGQWVCAEPHPVHPKAACGRPVESEPCNRHDNPAIARGETP